MSKLNFHFTTAWTVFPIGLSKFNLTQLEMETHTEGNTWFILLKCIYLTPKFSFFNLLNLTAQNSANL